MVKPLAPVSASLVLPQIKQKQTKLRHYFFICFCIIEKVCEFIRGVELTMYTLSDEELLKIYYCSVDMKLDTDFLDLLLNEIKKGEIRMLVYQLRCPKTKVLSTYCNKFPYTHVFLKFLIGSKRYVEMLKVCQLCDK